MTSIRFAALALALTLGPGLAQAQNLLTNPNFDADLGSWTTASGATWDGTDGSPAAGSMLLSSTAAGRLQVYQCQLVTAGQSYDFGASVRPGGTAPGTVGDGLYVFVLWFSDAACSVFPAQSSVFLQPASSGTWTRYAAGAQTAPAGTHSAMLLIRLDNFAGLPNLGYRVDSAFLGPSGTVPVELQNFRVD